jgi:hypothetical protein
MNVVISVAREEIIVHGGIRCTLCDTELFSWFRHDFKYCKCGACFVDGGFDYLRAGYTKAGDSAGITCQVRKYYNEEGKIMGATRVPKPLSEMKDEKAKRIEGSKKDSKKGSGEATKSTKKSATRPTARKATKRRASTSKAANGNGANSRK